MIVQEFIKWDQYVRCLCLGQEEVLPMPYDPNEKKYIADPNYLSPALKQRIVDDSLKLVTRARLRHEHGRVGGPRRRALRHRLHEPGAGHGHQLADAALLRLGGPAYGRPRYSIGEEPAAAIDRTPLVETLLMPNWLNRTVVGASVTSFLADVGYEMATAVFAPFSRALNLPAIAVGAIEGSADLLSNVAKLGTGWLGDRLGRRKPFVVAGYALSGSALSLWGLAVGWPLLLAAKMIAWFGKGIRGPLRNAILAEAVTEQTIAARHSACIEPRTQPGRSSGRSWVGLY